MHISGTVVVSLTILAVFIMISSGTMTNDRHHHSVSEIRDLLVFVHNCIPDRVGYKSIFHDQKIVKSVMPRKWSESHPTNSYNEDSGDHHRFDVHLFKDIVKGVGFPIILDSIFDQMNYYSKYKVGYSIFWIYSSVLVDSSPIVADIFKVYKMMLGLADPSLKNKEYVFHIFLVDNPKRYTTFSGELVGTPSTINSGRTIGNKVFIWRKEEICKVFIHEMIHLLKLDLGPYRTAVNHKFSNLLNVTFTSSSVYSLHEAFTETLTKILYASFLGAMRKTEFEYELELEVMWSLDQCARILHLNGVRNVLGNFTLEQKTFMYEYYVLHALFMWDAYTTEDYGRYLNFIHANSKKKSFSSISNILSQIDTSTYLAEIQKRLEIIPDNFGEIPVTLKMSRQ